MILDLFGHILSTEDYINTMAQLDKVSDAEGLLDFFLTVLGRRFPFSDWHSWAKVGHKNQSRFMLEVFSKMHMVPSLNVAHDPDNYTLPLLLYILRRYDLMVRHSSGPEMYYT